MGRPLPRLPGADLTADLHVLGIRHHGPGSARAVGAALAALDPEVVVVEGPPELDAVAPLAASAGMRPPVAALAYVPAEPRRASFYPMAAFSPEWVALRWALAQGREVRFADLPAAMALAEDEPRPEGSAVRRDPLAALAAAAGFDDPERWWEDAVEHRHHGLDAFAAVLDAMAEVRSDLGDAEADLVREAAMRKVLRPLADRRVAVVCGAWHAPALVPDRWPTAASDNGLLKGRARVKVAATWVPWTAARLAFASGYGAGVASPGWYQHLFTAPDEPVARWLVRTARLLRDEQVDASSASVIEAHRLADGLAALRGRPLPGLAELWDATEAVLCEGSPVPMRLVEQRLLVGDDLGRVPDETPMVPLARDLAAQQKRLRLKPTATPSTQTLDLRTESHLARSHLFHRLLLLGIDWAEPAARGRTTGTFKEVWTLEWRPELEIAVIEASAAGTTVAAAAADAVARRAAEADIAELCALVEQVLLADLPGSLALVVGALEERSALQHDVVRLMAAVEPLARVARYGDVRGADVAVVAGVLDGIVRRACVGLPAASLALDDEAAERLRRRIDGVQRGLATLPEPGLREAWAGALATVAGHPGVHGLVAGRAVRLLLDGGRLEVEEATRRLSVVLSTAAEPSRAAAFLEGFLAGEAVLLLHDADLLRAVDAWLTRVPSATFDDVLPVVRRAFSGYEPAERRLVGEHVRRVRGGTDPVARPDDDVDPERAARPEPLVRALLGLPPREDDGA